MSTKLGTLTLDLVARIGSFTQGMKQASSSAEREMRNVERSVLTVDDLIKKLAVTVGTAFSVSQVVNYADSYTGILNKLKLVTEGQGQLSTAMDDTHKIAQATASDWDSVVTVYTKFQKISEGLGLTQMEVARITETVTKAIGMSGATADEGQRALTQFGQALNTGALKGQDLNSILSQTPGLTDAIAEGMGIASKDLKQLGADGKLTNEVIIESLTKVASSVDAKYSQTATLISASFSLVKNQAIKMIGEFDHANGVSKTFVESMGAVAENIENITKVMIVGATYMAGSYIPMIVKGTYATVQDTISKTANVLALRAKAVADLDVAKSNLAATAAMVRAMGVTNAQTAAMMTNARAAYQQAAAAKAVAFSGTGLLGILGGPVGMGVTLAAVTAGYLLMRDGSQTATAAINIQGQSVQDLIEKYAELNTLQRDNETKALADQVEQLSLKYRVASSDLYSFMQALPISDDKLATFAKLNSQLSLGKISTDNYYNAVKNVNILTDDQLDKVRGLIGGYTDAKNKFGAAEVAQKALKQSMNATTKEAKDQAVEVAKLSDEIKKLLTDASKNIVNSKVTTALANRGYSDDLIALTQKYLAVEGAIIKNEQGRSILRPELQKSLNAEYIELQKQKGAIDKRNDAEKTRTKELEKQAKITKAMTIDKVISSGEGTYNSVNLGQRGGYKASTRNLTEMTVAQVLSSQQAKEFNAAGKYQVINSTLKGAIDVGVVSSAEKFSAEIQERIFQKYLVALKRPEIKGFITGNTGANLNDALLGTAKEFASVANPTTGKSYHAGVGNNKASISTEKMTESLLAQQKIYRENIALGMDSEKAWLNSFNSSASVMKAEELDIDKFLDDMIKHKQEQAAKQKEINLNIASEEVRIRSKLADDIKGINESGFDDAEKTRLISEYQRRADIDIQIAQANHDDKLSIYSDYLKTEEQLTNDSFARRQRDLKLDLTLTVDEYKKASILWLYGIKCGIK